MKRQVLEDVAFYGQLLEQIIRDTSRATPSEAACHRDIATASSRLSHEGLPFVTRILPGLAKALLGGLESGVFKCPYGFATKRGTNLPNFMFERFKTIFDSQGVVLDNPDPYSILEIRQVSLLFYKLELPFSKEQERAAEAKFCQIESDMSDTSFGACDKDVVYKAQALLSRLFSGLDLRDINPQHGPGSVNTGEKGPHKWEFKRLFDDLHQCYPYYEYFITHGKGEMLDRISWYKNLERLSHSTSTLHFVPKDSRGPRSICIEPLEKQFIQQGQMRSIVRHVERHRLTSGFVNFSDQSINQKLAVESSMTQQYATLDLKDASDRVHVNLVRILFPEDITKLLMSTRSTHVKLPSGNVINLRKFASMGSACCFPIMALTLWSLIRAYLDLKNCSLPCFVYGDDIIVPNACSSDVQAMLETFGLQVNREKSYCSGLFRESCGSDAYNGVDVRPIYLRRPVPTRSSDTGSYTPYVALCNRMFDCGLWGAYGLVIKKVQGLFGQIPYGTARSSFPSLTISCPFLASELNKKLKLRSRRAEDLQREEFRVLIAKSNESKVLGFGGWERLLRNLTQGPDCRERKITLTSNFSPWFTRYTCRGDEPRLVRRFEPV